MTTHIITMGGGGFSMSSNGAATELDRYLVDLTGKSAPLVCFVPTAAADDPTYIREFLTCYGALGVRTMVVTLWENAQESVKRMADADVIYVGGGSTANLLALWRVHRVDHMLQRLAASDEDVVFAGISAGGACWYSGCVTDSFGDVRPWTGGLGLLEGSFCPHWDGEKQRQAIFTDAVATGLLPSGWGVEDGAALHWIDGRLDGAISEREGARAIRLEASNEPTTSGVLSIPLDVEQL